MLVDARELAAALVHADLCIVGAGPAGVALAREFAGGPHSVVLLESGGLELEPEAQPLGQADRMSMAPKNISKLKTLRTRRQFGGNASAWGVRVDRSDNSVRLTPLAAIDFEPRDWMPGSGWPIRRDDLAGHYGRAQEIFALPADARYDAAPWESPDARRLPLPEDRLETAVFQFGLGESFHKAYRDELAAAKNVQVLHHATALEVETDPTGRLVRGLRVASAPGREFRVEARHVVLAGGAMGVTQILLNSRGATPEGLGNRHDLVGRYYMDHPILNGGYFIPGSPELMRDMALYDLRTVNGVPVLGYLQLPEAALRRERLPQMTMMFFPRKEAGDVCGRLSTRQQLAIEAARRTRGALRRRQLPQPGDLGRMARGLDGLVLQTVLRPPRARWSIGGGGWSRETAGAHPYRSFEVFQQVEQPPHRDNRVYLSDRRDALGAQRISIDWRWHDEDIARAMQAQDYYADVLRRSGLGRFEPFRPGGRPRVRALSTAHYMGTTRMHADAREGVVDARCELHDVRNLFVASSSVFPTGGFANPTLTIVALALRIGDEIRRRLETPLQAGGGKELAAE